MAVGAGGSVVCVWALNPCQCRLFVTPWTVPAWLLCPWDSPGKNTGVGCHALLLAVFLTRGSSPRSCVSCTGRQVLSQVSRGGPGGRVGEGRLFLWPSCQCPVVPAACELLDGRHIFHLHWPTVDYVSTWANSHHLLHLGIH